MSITLHMVTSLDGFIAKKTDDYSWMESSWGVYKKGTEIPTDVGETIDCYIMGSHTYELALKLGWPYGDIKTIVLTHRNLSTERKNVEFQSGNLSEISAKLGPKNIWLVGGAIACQEFLRQDLVDRICLTVVPIVLGDGIPLFQGIEHKLYLKDVTAFENGMIDLWYLTREPSTN